MSGPYRDPPPVPPPPTWWQRVRARLRRFFGGAVCLFASHRWVWHRIYYGGAGAWRMLPPFPMTNGADCTCNRCGLEVRDYDRQVAYRQRLAEARGDDLWDRAAELDPASARLDRGMEELDQAMARFYRASEHARLSPTNATRLDPERYGVAGEAMLADREIEALQRRVDDLWDRTGKAVAIADEVVYHTRKK